VLRGVKIDKQGKGKEGGIARERYEKI